MAIKRISLPVSVLQLLAYSWEDIGFEYDGLTGEEKSLMSEEDFDAIIRAMVTQGLIEV